MKLQVMENGTSKIALVEEIPAVIETAADALDLMMNVRYESDADKMILLKHQLDERFFDLKTGLAGEILQKYVTYQMKLAIVGDFSGYDSKSLRDFIYESNKVSQVFFMPDVPSAVQALHGVK